MILFNNHSSQASSITDFESYEFRQPYLIGFDCSRPSEAETWSATDFNAENNMYRHPDRWGRPSRFERHHDIYALVSRNRLLWQCGRSNLMLHQGTLLLEIGLWRPLHTLDSKKKSFTWISPQKLHSFYLEIACPRLAHAAENRFASAVETCLRQRNWEKFEEWQSQRLIRQSVIATSWQRTLNIQTVAILANSIRIPVHCSFVIAPVFFWVR